MIIITVLICAIGKGPGGAKTARRKMENKFFNLDVKIKINIMPMMLIIIMQTKITTMIQVAKKPAPLRELKRGSQVEALGVFSPRRRGLAPENHLIIF